MNMFSYVCWPHKCLLLKSVCSYPSLSFECFFFSCKSILVLCRFWILGLCLMGRLQKFFSHSVACWFTLMIIHFAVHKILSLIRSYLFILTFVVIAFDVLIMKSLPVPMSWMVSWMVLPRFSSRVFMVLLCLNL